MNMVRSYTLALVLGLAFSMCGDVIEEDISGREVVLLSPADSAVLTMDTVSFWWEPVDGARSYEFHLVSPGFEAASRVWMDSVTTSNLITMVLPTGAYEWEVSGFNAGYATQFFYRSFRIDTTASGSEIALQGQPEIISPTNGSLIIGKTAKLWWEKMPGATQYEVRLVSPSFSDLQELLLDTLTTSNKMSVSLPEGSYEWELRGTNASYASDWVRQSFAVDSVQVLDISQETIGQLSPSQDVLIIGAGVDLWWEQVTGATAYHVKIASPNLANPQRVLLDTSISQNQLHKALPPGTYEWQVRGANARYQTGTASGTFRMDVAVDISGSIVKLSAPGDSLVTSMHDLTFWWEELAGAETYDFILVSPSFEHIELLVNEQELVNNKLQLNLDSGSYQWGVRAKNEAYVTPLSIRNLYINSK
ncbi:hypothetical protein [Marinoscillum luteum]|uniref:SusE outer membrane protein domain-containing protein n=1 Tax=Marinoscillum luteum TaxID=861051 RepID=A0ABW7NJR7_9BACT